MNNLKHCIVMSKILEIGEYILNEGTTLERTGKFVSIRPLIKYINKPRCLDCKHFIHGRATKCGLTTTVCSLQKKNVVDKEGQVLYYHIGSRQIACDKFKYTDNQKYIAKDMKLTYKDIEIILGIENNILHECNDNSQLVIEAYPKGEDYYGEILRRFNNQRIKPQRMISAEAKEAMYDKPACAWSEEDEVYLNTTIAYLKDAQEFKKTAENCIDWLKKLKQRNRR